MLVLGLVLDQPKVTWTPEEIMDPSKQPHLKVELADVARRRESIVLEVESLKSNYQIRNIYY